MPEHLRALVVIVAMTVAVFVVAQRPMTKLLMSVGDFSRRRNVWIAVTLIAFLSHNFWIYAALMSALLLATARREANPLALYALLIMAVPSYSTPIPGAGLVNYFVELHHVRLLNLVLLLPVAVRFMLAPAVGAMPVRKVDGLVLAYLGYRFFAQLPVDSLTGNMRNVFALLVDLWLPYYVASRSFRNLTVARETVAALVLGFALLAPLAVFEATRGWMLYDSLGKAMGVDGSRMSFYLRREGALRANATAGNAIVLGYAFMIGLIFTAYLVPLMKSRLVGSLAVGLLVAGLVAALSRGPWVGAAAGLLVAIGTGRDAMKRWGWMVVSAAAVLPLLFLTSAGERVLDYLPFVGTVESRNVDYRQQLLTVSMTVFWQNPMFGSLNFILNPALEEMRQGQGIIDIVNSYIAIALAYGWVGLMFFLLQFVYAMYIVLRAQRRAAAVSFEAERLGRSLVGVMCAILLTIATVSSIGIIPAMYMLMLGLCAGYGSHVNFPSRASSGHQVRAQSLGVRRRPATPSSRES